MVLVSSASIAFIIAYLVWGVKESDVELKTTEETIKVSLTQDMYYHVLHVGVL